MFWKISGSQHLQNVDKQFQEYWNRRVNDWNEPFLVFDKKINYDEYWEPILILNSPQN